MNIIRNKTAIILSLACVTLLYSCKKEHEPANVIAGHVKAKHNNLPVDSVTVELFHKPYSSGVYAMQRIATLITGPDGGFNFSLPEEDGYSYFITLYNPSYIHSDYLVASKGSTDLEYQLAPKGYLKYQLTNNSNADEIAIGYPCYFDCNFYGANVGTLTNGNVVEGGMTHVLYYLVYNFNIDTIKYQTSVYVPPFDTAVCVINY